MLVIDSVLVIAVVDLFGCFRLWIPHGQNHWTLRECYGDELPLQMARLGPGSNADMTQTRELRW